MYTLAASAAGVGMLALAQPAEAKIIYTKVHAKILNSSYYLVLNNEGVTDFELGNSWYSGGEGSDFKARLRLNAVSKEARVETSASYYRSITAVAALKRGAKIPTEQTGLKDGGALLYFSSNGIGNRKYQGKWLNARNIYFGLKFQVRGKTHYGWARVSVTDGRFCAGILTGYAYETIANKPINAGKTKGPDVVTVQPGTLGHLAAGASAILSWRSGE
jgi:hypothetical protein